MLANATAHAGVMVRASSAASTELTGPRATRVSLQPRQPAQPLTGRTARRDEYRGLSSQRRRQESRGSVGQDVNVLVGRLLERQPRRVAGAVVAVWDESKLSAGQLRERRPALPEGYGRVRLRVARPLGVARLPVVPASSIARR